MLNLRILTSICVGTCIIMLKVLSVNVLYSNAVWLVQYLLKHSINTANFLYFELNWRLIELSLASYVFIWHFWLLFWYHHLLWDFSVVAIVVFLLTILRFAKFGRVKRLYLYICNSPVHRVLQLIKCWLL